MVSDDAYFDSECAQFGCHTDGNSAVGDDAIEFGSIGDVDETAFVEFGRVEHGDYFVCLLNHQLIEKRFFQIMGRDAVFDGEGVHSEEQFAAVEIAQHRERQRSDGRKAFFAHITAEQNHIKPLVVHQFDGNIHRVGNDVQILKFVQVLGYFESRCSGVEHEVIAVLDEFRCFRSDALFLLEIEHLLFGDGGVFVLVVDGFSHRPSACA